MAAEKKARLNDEINVPEVRLIGADGEQVGVLSTARAIEMAQEAQLDLVEVAPQAKPPVCRVMDYGKYVFEQKKKKQVAKGKQKQVHLKEVKFRPGTEEGDYRVKLRNLIRFLEDGDRAKVTLRFRGREVTHPELGRRLLTRVEEDLAEIATVEQLPRMEGRQMVMMMAPKKHGK